MNDRKFINDIKNKILTSSNIFVMGHRGIDLDAFGSCLGIFYIAQSLNKNCYIILEEDSSDTSIVKAKKELENRNIESSFYKTKDILDKIDDKSLLIIVDTNKKELVQSKELYDRISEKIVFDHHTFENNNDFLYFYIDDKISSTSEIIISLIISLDVSIPSFVATIMLGGISIDTNNFTLKTGYNTYLSASILTRLGADNKEVQQLLKEDVSEYFDIQKVIQNILIVKEKIALCVCDDGIYDKEFLAKVASTVLSFDNIELSFAIGKLSEDVIGISARSIGEISASKFMEKLGGGGRDTDAATQIKKATLSEVKEELLKLIKEDDSL